VKAIEVIFGVKATSESFVGSRSCVDQKNSLPGGKCVNVVADRAAIWLTLSPVESVERFEFLVLSAGIFDTGVGKRGDVSQWGTGGR
jgi:hypothetical protein